MFRSLIVMKKESELEIKMKLSAKTIHKASQHSDLITA